MFGIGTTELFLFLLVVLVLFRASRIPELLHGVAWRGRRQSRARVSLGYLESSVLVTAAILTLLAIAIAILGLATPAH